MKRQRKAERDDNSRRERIHKAAFTLIELIVVMAVIGILVLLAAPKFLSYTQRAQDTKYIHTAKVIETALEAYLIHGGEFPDNLEVVDPTLLADAAAKGNIIGVEGYIISPDEETYYEMNHEFLKKLDIKLSADSTNNEFIIEALADSAPKAIYASTKGKTLLNKEKILMGYVSESGGTTTPDEGIVGGPIEVPVDVPINRECTFEVTDAKYLTYETISVGKVRVTGLSAEGSSLTELSIPSIINGVNVVEVASGAFYGKSLTSVCIPESIVTIGTSAFASNANLKKVIMNGNTSVSYNAITHPFKNTALNEVIFGDNVTLVQSYMFYDAIDLKSIDLNNVNIVGTSAFQGAGLAEIDLKNVTRLFSSAFAGSAVTKVTVGKTITDNYSNSYNNYNPFLNTSLNEVVIGDDVTSIPDYMFYQNGLTSINLNNVTKIGIAAFYKNGLTSLDLRNVTNVGDNAFSSNNIDFIDLKKVTTLGAGAFASNANLKKVIMNGNTSVSYNAITHPFKNTALNEVIFGDNVTLVQSYMFYDAIDLKSIDLNNVNIVGTSAFQGAGLTEIDLKNVTRLHSSAFAGSAITKVTVGKTITDNYSNSYNNYNPFLNTSLNEVVIGDAVTEIPSNMFYQNSLTSINLNNVTKIGAAAFYKNGLTSLDLRNVTNVGDNAFSSNNIDFIDLKKVTTLGAGAFASNANLKKVIMNGNTSVSYNAITHPFKNTALNEVIFGDNVTLVQSYMFYGATGLISIDLNNVNIVGTSAFQGAGLTEIDLKNVTRLHSSAFAGSAITKVTVGKTITDNYSNSYNNYNPFLNTSLNEVVIGDAVTEIPSNMFYQNSLTSINLNNVTKIGTAAFYGNRIPQGAAISNKLANEVIILSSAFNNNGIDGTTTITPTFRSN